MAEALQWRELVRAMAAAVLEVNEQGTILDIHGELPGAAPAAIGQGIHEILSEHREGDRELSGVADGSDPARGQLFELRSARGQPVPVRVWSTRDPSNSGPTLLAIRPCASSIATAREEQLRESLRRRMDEVEQLRIQLDELEAIRTHFLSASAHELKTPLTVIQTYLETLVTDLADGLSEEQHSFLRVAYDGVLRLRRLVVDLVDLAALSSGKLRLDIGRVELAPLVSGEIQSMEPLAARAGVDLNTDGDSASGAVRADTARVQQVLRNLLDNAIKFTPAGGSVTVTTSSSDDSVVLSVADTGIGIPADRLPGIFDEFFQASEHDQRSRRGAGLGLAISRRIVRSLGGRLEAESAENVGSTFHVYLPQWPEEESSPAE
jgi:signal transduction histidine kinase